MNIKSKAVFSGNFTRILPRALLVAGFLFGLTPSGHAVAMDPGSGWTNAYTPLDFWSFQDNTYWTSDLGYAPVSFTNLNFSNLGNGRSVVVDTNLPAWLQYNVYENDGTTNLTVDAGTVMFWYAPGDWAGTNHGGSGPGEYGRLFEVGGYTPDSSYGLWSIYVDDGGNHLYFSAQTNDLSSNLTTYISYPISWTTNYFHCVALTYSATNTALYLDGVLATNGPGVTVYPGPDVLTNGFYLGSDETGIYQANGLFNSLATYNVPLDTNTLQHLYDDQHVAYIISPLNTAMANISSAPSTPSPFLTFYNIITGQGDLQNVGSVTAITSTNLWITNVTASVNGGSSTIRFTIQGGYDYVAYDVFANSVLTMSSNTNTAWAWKGQGFHGNIYTLTNLQSSTCFLILGTPLDSDFDGLTDAYEKLASKTNPYNSDTDGDGISDSDEILGGTEPLTSNPGWKLDTDNDGLPDAYESLVGWSPTTAEVAPVLPAYSANPIQ